MSSPDRYKRSAPVANRSGVYRAVDTVTGREVYVHVLDHEFQGDLLNRVRQRVSASDSADRSGMIEIIEQETATSVITEATPRCEDLEAWVGEAQPLPGEFTRLFEGPVAAAEEPPQSAPPGEPGEFTRIFESAGGEEPEPPNPEQPPVPPESPPSPTPGEFTMLFEQGAERAAPVEGDYAPAGPSPAGASIEDFFPEPGSHPEPLKPAQVQGETPTRTLKRDEPGGPPTGEAPAPTTARTPSGLRPSAPRDTGEVTHLLTRDDLGKWIYGEGDQRPPEQPPQQAPQPRARSEAPSALADDFDNLFGPEQPHDTPAEKPDPGNFTRLFSQPETGERRPASIEPSLSVPPKAGEAGSLTQILRGESPSGPSSYSRTPALDATRVFDAQSRTPAAPPPPPLVGEGEYTRMMNVPETPPAPPAESQRTAPSSKDSKEASGKRSPNIFLILALVFVTLLLIVIGVAWLINEFRAPETAVQPGTDEPAATSTTEEGQGARMPAGSPRVRGPSVRQPSVRGPSVQGSSVRGPSVRAPSVRNPSVTGARIPTRIPQSSAAQADEPAAATESGGRKYLIIIAVMGALLLVAMGVLIFMLVRR